MLTLLTPTRNRPRAFSYLEGFIKRQTFKGDLQWIVVCDGPTPYNYTMGQTVIHRDNSQDDPRQHSICLNYLAAIPHIQGSAVVCLDDDDWYSPDYLTEIADKLTQADLVGVAPARYYHVGSRRFRDLKNTTHCSLAATAFNRAVLPAFSTCCQIRNSPFVDMVLWPHWRDTLGGSALIFDNPPDNPLQVGIKGLNGGGAGLGHDPRSGIKDMHFRQLRQWLGQDADHYIR